MRSIIFVWSCYLLFSCTQRKNETEKQHAFFSDNVNDTVQNSFIVPPYDSSAGYIYIKSNVSVKNYFDFLFFAFDFVLLFLLGLLQLFSSLDTPRLSCCCICGRLQPSCFDLWGLLLCLVLLRGRWLLLERACTNDTRRPIR